MKSSKRDIYHGTKCDFLVFDRKLAESYISGRPYIMISIYDPLATQSEFQLDKNRLDLVRVPIDFIDEFMATERKIKLLADNEQGLQTIASFFLAHCFSAANNPPLVVIHCNAGLSRSPSIAAGLSLFINNDNSWFQEHFTLDFPLVHAMYEKILSSSFWDPFVDSIRECVDSLGEFADYNR